MTVKAGVRGQNAQQKLNRMAPAADEARLGDLLADLITTVNAHTVAINAIVAQLNGASIAGGPYVATTAVTQPALGAR